MGRMYENPQDGRLGHLVGSGGGPAIKNTNVMGLAIRFKTIQSLLATAKEGCGWRPGVGGAPGKHTM